LVAARRCNLDVAVVSMRVHFIPIVCVLLTIKTYVFLALNGKITDDMMALDLDFANPQYSDDGNYRSAILYPVK
jgi:hypothetical protein